jgi:hypothetical protein
VKQVVLAVEEPVEQVVGGRTRVDARLLDRMPNIGSQALDTASQEQKKEAAASLFEYPGSLSWLER